MSVDHSAQRRIVSLLCGLAFASLACVVHAQNLVAEAEALFREGRALMEVGRHEDACEKFAESQRLDPSSGTLLNLARCHRELGRTATAWAEYLAASRLALAQRQVERAEEARRRAAELEAVVGRLVVQVAEPVRGLVVSRNGETLPESRFGIALPLDPGEYKIVARAPRHVSFERGVVVKDDAQTVSVEIPRLELSAEVPLVPRVIAPRSQPIDRALPVPEEPKRKVPTSVWALGGTTLAAVATGGVFGGLALASIADARELCPRRVDCTREAIEVRDRAELQANVANVAFGVALAAAVTATIVILSSP